MAGANKPRGEVSGAVLVLGAGIAGMQSALDLAAGGYKVYLVDRNISIGGVMAQLDKTFPTNDCSTCMISPKLIEVASNPNIEVISRAQITGLSGQPGDFTAKVRKAARFVDEDVCSGCGECVKVCPVEVPADFNQGLNKRKAIYRHFPQAIPGAYAVDKLGVSPCKNACPAGVSAQGYVALIAQGRYKEALDLVRRDNPLPSVCGRVCTHPCEMACARAEVDDPVAIRELKRFVADWEVSSGETARAPKVEQTLERVAVVGSGPAGLTAAYYLALQGYRPDILEALPEPGGMLRVGIPAYRLPRETLEREIDYIRSAGVDILCNQTIGAGRGLEDLHKEGYEAVFVAVGAHKGLRMNLAGEGLAEVRSGVEFLRLAALGQEECPGERVAVIGGGNVAVDAARTALRLGSREVTILYRRTREEMPAYEDEIEEALEEGIKIEYLTAPIRFLDRTGRLSGVEVISMQLGEPDAGGRRRPAPVEGSERIITLDGVIMAIGQQPDLDFLEPGNPLESDRAARLRADPLTLQTNLPWVFAGGDDVTGPATVVEAIRHGKEAALSIHRYLRGLDIREGREPEDRPVSRGESQGVAREPRARAAQAEARSRVWDFSEVVEVFSEEQARAEAARCLACGICSECYQCLTVCQAGAINHAMQPTDLTLKVGALILAPGFTTFDPAGRPEFGYGRWPNVVTSLEFERMNSASGPFGGHLKRPGDGKEPKKVAWIQCVGSRDAAIGRDYCSYVCCMYATKQAVIAAEHVPGLEGTIFYMDIRAQGKGFDRYQERAQKGGVRYLRSIPSRVLEDPATGDLILSWREENGEEHEERFDIVVLSVGLVPHAKGVETAGLLGVDTDRFGFAARQGLNPLLTSREGVFTCGAFQAPRDIPDTVMQASGAAAQAGEMLAPARGKETSRAEYPPERDIRGEDTRIGVFVCHCGVNIGGVVDVPGVVDYASGLPGVVHAQDFLFTCSTDSQEKMAQVIREEGLNRVVVASCSPRTHEPLFQDTLKNAGLNPYLFEMANIRDQCSWVHQGDHPAATEKSRDLVRMSAARAALLAPLTRKPAPVNQTAVVIGGGLAGMTAAESLAGMGFAVHLVEKSEALGGLARRLHMSPEGFPIAAEVERLADRVTHDGLIRVHTGTRVAGVAGRVGAMVSTLVRGDRKEEVEHGALILATGAREYQPTEYLFGRDPRVVTQLTLHQRLWEEEGLPPERVVMIQCVGSRTEEHSYCSRICCTQAVANALKLKELNPSAKVAILYRDIRTYSLKELLYRKAREAGVLFIRFDPERPPQVDAAEGGIQVRLTDPLLNRDIELEADLLALSAAVRPGEDTGRLAGDLKLPVDADGFFMEAHLKLRPVDFVNAGFFLAGSAHGPKPAEEVISQAKAAASRAATVLSQKEMLVGGEVAVVDAERCVACLTCVRTCPYGVPQLNEDGVVFIDPAACQGCGSCASACPRKLIQVGHHTDAQIMAKARAAGEGM